MLFSGLAHVCLKVKDLQRTIDDYHRLGLSDGFKFIRQGKDYGIYLKIRDTSFIEIFEEPDMAEASGTGIAHFCLETQDMDALMKHLDAQGVNYTPNKQGGDFTWQIWLEDPDGNKFEVHQYSEKSMQLVGGVCEADW